MNSPNLAEYSPPPPPFHRKYNCLYSCNIKSFLIIYSRNCPKGFYGDNCGRRCPYPNYGRYCSLICDCTEQNCHHANGCPRLGTCINYWWEQMLLICSSMCTYVDEIFLKVKTMHIIFGCNTANDILNMNSVSPSIK